MGTTKKKKFIFNKNEHVFYKGTYYHISDKKNLIFLLDKKEYIHKESISSITNLVFGVYKFEEINKEIIIETGYFIKNIYNESNILINDNNLFSQLNCSEFLKNFFKLNYLKIYLPYNNVDDLLKDKSPFIFCPYIDCFLLKSYKKKSEATLSKLPQRVATERAYNIEDNKDYESSKSYYANYDLKIDNVFKKYKKYLKDYTFGVEIETNQGKTHSFSLKRYGFSVCRDGSISNEELVSVPLKGIKGLQTIKDFMEINKYNVTTDINCSLHVHIGNIRKDKIFINALMNFLYYFQEDYFSYFPYYKKQNILGKRKNYTKALPPLCSPIEFPINKESFNDLINKNNNNVFSFLTNGINSNNSFNKNNKRHPNSQKWDRANRYYAFNLMNLLFSNRGTLEFRIHENTFNYNRVINQILLSIAIVEYVNNNIQKCLKGEIVSLETVISEYFQVKTKEKLMKYYNHRKNLFNSSKFDKFTNYTDDHYSSF